jgi:MYXO-CTERM domain-containing protein
MRAWYARSVARLVGLAALFAGCTLTSSATAELVWTEVTTLDGSNPALAPAPGGGVHVLLADGSLRHVEIDSGGGVVADEMIPDTAGAADGYAFGPALAVSAGSIHVAFARDHGNWMLSGHHVSKGASGWSPVLDLQASTERGYAPSIAVDALGDAHVLFGAATTVPFGIANYYRVSGGAVSQTHAALVEWRADDRSAIVTGPNGSVHALGGYPSPSGHISYAMSMDAGTTFSAPIEIQPPNVGSHRVGQPHAVVDASGQLHMVFGAGEEAGAACDCAVHYATISSSGIDQTSVVTPSGVLLPWHLSLGIARVALLPSGLRAVSWQQHAGDDGVAPVSSSTSADGQSWSAPQTVADDCGGSEGRNTIDLVSSGETLWLACPKGSSVRLFRATEGAASGCDPAAPFSVPSVAPASGSGPEQAFVTRIAHCEGAGALRIVQLRVTKVVDAQEPAVAPAFEAGAFHLDAQSCAPGEATELVSTYGSLDCASSSVVEDGDEMAVTFALRFDVEAFAGERGLFMDAKGGSPSPEPRLGWTEVGSWTVAASTAGSGGSSGGAPGDRGGVSGDDSGCGCRSAGVASSASVSAWLIGLMLSLAIRRRQARG